MTIRVTPPLEIENLLPYDFQSRILDNTLRRDYQCYVSKGSISPVYHVQPSHILSLSITVIDTGK
jgi:vacuolar protein sorting-associated protein 13A/C